MEYKETFALLNRLSFINMQKCYKTHCTKDVTLKSCLNVCLTCWLLCLVYYGLELTFPGFRHKSNYVYKAKLLKNLIFPPKWLKSI